MPAERLKAECQYPNDAGGIILKIHTLPWQLGLLTGPFRNYRLSHDIVPSTMFFILNQT
jgi:hypothetical protein